MFAECVTNQRSRLPWRPGGLFSPFSFSSPYISGLLDYMGGYCARRSVWLNKFVILKNAECVLYINVFMHKYSYFCWYTIYIRNFVQLVLFKTINEAGSFNQFFIQKEADFLYNSTLRTFVSILSKCLHHPSLPRVSLGSYMLDT